MIDKHQVLKAEVRLTAREIDQSLERVGRQVTRLAAADRTLNTGGTVRKLVKELIRQLESAATRLIAAHVQAGVVDPEEIASKVRGALEHVSNTFLSSHAKRIKLPGAWGALRHDVEGFFDSLIDRATVALAEYPKAMDRLIAELIPERLPSGWDRVDRALQKARSQLALSREEEDFQNVGLLCRETLISISQAVYEPDRHHMPGEVLPSDTDVKRQLDSYFAIELAGESNEPMRKHARSALDLANTLQHQRTPTFRLSSLCLEATSSVVSIVVIVAGTRSVASY